MIIRHRLAAVAVTLGLAAAGLAVAAPAAQAAPTPQAAPKACKIEGFTPSTVVVGLSPQKVKFTPKTSGCKVTYWSITADSSAVSNKNPYAVLKPSELTKVQDVVVQAGYSPSQPPTEMTFVDGLHVKPPTAFNTRTKAGPEPAVAVWKNNAYAGYSGQPVKVQFRAPGGKYKTVKTVKTGQYGVAQTTVTAKKSGTWRIVFAGSSTATSSTARGDYVKVKS